MMLQIKFDHNRPAGLGDIHVWKCGRTDGRTHARVPSFKLTLWAFGSGELKICFMGWHVGLAFLGQLKWESLKKRRKDNRLILLYKGLKGKASVPTDDLIPKTRRCRNQHSMAFQTPIANTDVYKGSFFPHTIRDWNALPDSLISSAEDAEDCAAKFTSLVRARD